MAKRPTDLNKKELSRKQQSRTLTSLTKTDRDHAFETTMHLVHENMSELERQFSLFIHRPTIEVVSEAIGKSIGRPSCLLSATITACTGLVTVYGVARFVGFQLSGSELLLLIVLGFLGGLLIEWVAKSLQTLFITKRK